MMCGKEITSKLRLSYLKYLGLASVSLAIIASTTMTAVGGGFPDSVVASATNITNSTLNTGTDNSSVSASSTNATTGPVTLAISLTDAAGADSNTVSITAPTGGGVAVSNQTIRVTTNAVDGYNAQLSAAGSQTAMT
ncbi:MAG: hypothetical protein Q4C83_02730, partial [Candidatus Saccharibacteria bacterium]|nr:hypothetical protein [Candidatus Saccharibacteria bacterium]